MTRRTARFGGTLALGACVWVVSGCAPARVRLPDGPGVPAPGSAAVFTEASAPCRGVRTLTAEIAVSGRLAGQKLRGRILAGFERPGALRIEALAPFGPPVFVLVVRGGRATLVWPRDRRVLAGATSNAVIEALTGLDLAADDLRAVISGCLVSEPHAEDGQSFTGGWIALAIAPRARAFLRQVAGRWTVVAGHLGSPTGAGQGPGMTIEYTEFAGGMPRSVRVWQDPTDGRGVPVALVFGMSQVETNVAIDPAAFDAIVPAGAVPMTLDELRQAGPLGIQPGRSR